MATERAFKLAVTVEAAHVVIVTGSSLAVAKRRARRMVEEWQNEVASPEDFLITIREADEADG